MPHLNLSLRKIFFLVAGCFTCLYAISFFFHVSYLGEGEGGADNSSHSEKTPPRFHNTKLSATNYNRREAVRAATRHAWAGYKKHAWGKDELQPLTQRANTRWGDWAITMVDSLDTLKIMELEDEYLEAKAFVSKIRFDRSPYG
ncbi:hypothetical protein IWW38_004432, partial [Coemansia aciculifera]